ncbi:hypothetical protein [Streptomyces sp. NPDC000410]|uniref:hypothetical protein n=1 Tax=Streptomyces sp. NPDC000410 TaxID=3154254 RepID=UPI0033311809
MAEEVVARQVSREPTLRFEAEAEPRAELSLDLGDDQDRILQGGLRADVTAVEPQARAEEIQFEPQTRLAETQAREVEPQFRQAEARQEPLVGRQFEAEPMTGRLAEEPATGRFQATAPMTERVQAEPMTGRLAEEPTTGRFQATAPLTERWAAEPQVGRVRESEPMTDRQVARQAEREPRQRATARTGRRDSGPKVGPNGEVTLTTKDDELIVIVPSQMRLAVPRFEDVAQQMARLGSDVQFVTDQPIEGDPANETYKAIMESLKDAPKVIDGFGKVSEGIGKIGEAVEGMAKLGEMAEDNARANMDALNKGLPTSVGSAPTSNSGYTGGGRRG